jgi:hypothetical protein
MIQFSQLVKLYQKSKEQKMKQNLWQDKQETVWRLNAFDKVYWNEACAMFSDDSTDLDAADDYISRKVGGGRLIRDTFHLLHKRNVDKRSSVPGDLQAVEKVLDMALNMDELETLKASTVGNRLESAIAARDLATRLAKSLPRDLRNKARGVEQAQEKVDAATSALDEILDDRDAELGCLGEQAPDELVAAYEQKIGEANDLLDKLEANLGEAIDDLDESASQSQGAIGVAVQEALEETDEQLEQVIAFVKAFTEAAGGEVNGGIDLEALKWAKQALKDCPAMTDFADILGWGQRTMRAIWRDSLRSKADPAGIKPKQYDPQTVVMTEQTALQGGYGKPMQVDARMRLTEDKILHYHKEGGEEQEGLGDCHLMIDVSGSMSNQELQVAFAMQWGLLEAFKKDDRGLSSTQFAGHRQFETWQAPRNGDPADPEGLYKSLSRKFSGGTEPYGPLESILNSIIESGDKADVVIYTDGYFAAPSPEILGKIDEVKALTSSRIFVINSGIGSNDQAEKFADLSIYVSSLYEDRSKIVELFKSIV